jgi:hypothetical protein
VDEGEDNLEQVSFQVRFSNPFNCETQWGMTYLDTDRDNSTGDAITARNMLFTSAR